MTHNMHITRVSITIAVANVIFMLTVHVVTIIIILTISDRKPATRVYC